MTTPTLYRARFEWPHGKKSHFTYVAPNAFRAVQQGGALVKKLTKGYLLEIEELRPFVQQELRLVSNCG